RRARRRHRPRRGDRLPGDRAPRAARRMTAAPDPPPAAGWWRDWYPLPLVLLALAFYLRNVGTAEGQYNDFITHWTLARLAVTGHGAGAYDFVTQAALLRVELPADRLGFLESKHIAGIGVSPY